MGGQEEDWWLFEDEALTSGSGERGGQRWGVVEKGMGRLGSYWWRAVKIVHAAQHDGSARGPFFLPDPSIA